MRYRSLPVLAAVAGVCAAAAPRALAQDREFIFASENTSYTGLIFQSDPLVGAEVTQARILLTITVPAGGDASLFNADIALPIEPFPGNTNVVAITGISEGWSGSGTFSIDRTVTIYNGIVRSGLFGAETILPSGFVHQGSVVQIWTIPAPGASAAMAVAGLLAARRRRR